MVESAVRAKSDYKAKFKDYPDVMDVVQMCEVLNISTKTGYRLLMENQVEHLKIGRAYRIPKAHIISYLRIVSSNL